jgi:hypothetical protein
MLKTLNSLVRRGMELNRVLTISTLAMVAMAVTSAALLLLDPRVITGAPAWLKPLKFFVSISLYNVTWLWLIARIDPRARWLRRSGNIFGGVASLEMVLIVAQVLRGTRSHFNGATPFDQALGAVMGAAITVLWVATGVVAVAALRRRFAEPVLAWGIRLGLIAAVLGMGTGYLMFRPKPEQLAALKAGQPTDVGGHAVGAPDDGPGYAVVGWSKTGGDWRPAHFVGLHGLQVLPLVALLISRRRSRALTESHRVALVATAALAWVGLLGVLVSQALRAQPLLRPDAGTLGALGAVVALALASAAAIEAHARLGASPPASVRTA